jgi:hypothetical protein
MNRTGRLVHLRMEQLRLERLTRDPQLPDQQYWQALEELVETERRLTELQEN